MQKNFIIPTFKNSNIVEIRIKAIKFFIAILIPVLFLNNFAYELLFILQKNIIREEFEKEIIKKLKVTDLSIFIVDVNTFDKLLWIEAYKEFIYKDMMYDVIKIETKNSKKYIYCISDKKEKSLIKEFQESQKKENKIDDTKKFHLFFQYLNSLINIEYAFENINTFIKKLPLNFLQFPTPPPEF
ncbi:MAG: hypothetical protein N3A01_01090 [Bacteroidales bacterium]|nr:hypothetical protein [Bacteroidales bacterium]